MSEDAARVGTASGPGAALLAERRSQNLSLGDVSRQLKLSVRQVEALERDDFSGFQGPVFIHGFLRNYAKLLGLDPNPLIRAADGLLKPVAAAGEPETAAPAPATGRNAKTGKARWPTFAGIAAAIVIVGLLAMNSRAPSPAKPRPAIDPASQLAGTQAPAEKRQAAGKPADKPAPEKPAEDRRAAEKPTAEKPPEKLAEKPAERPAAAEETAEKPGVAAAPENLPQAASEAAAAEPGGPRIIVRMVFDQESWVEIKDRNGNTVFGQLNAAGTRRSASGEPPLSIVVGNAAGVRLFQGDKSIDLSPHTRVDVARLTLE